MFALAFAGVETASFVSPWLLTVVSGFIVVFPQTYSLGTAGVLYPLEAFSNSNSVIGRNPLQSAKAASRWLLRVYIARSGADAVRFGCVPLKGKLRLFAVALALSK